MPTITKDRILSAMAGKMAPEDAAAIADILCGTAQPPIQVYDDETAFLPDDGTDGTRGPMASKQDVADAFDKKMLLTLPAKLFCARWLQGRIKEDFGVFGYNAFNAAVSKAGDGVCEAVLLAAVLKEAYGEKGLPALADACIFSRSAYAAFRDPAQPILDKYIY